MTYSIFNVSSAYTLILIWENKFYVYTCRSDINKKMMKAVLCDMLKKYVYFLYFPNVFLTNCTLLMNKANQMIITLSIYFIFSNFDYQFSFIRLVCVNNKMFFMRGHAGETNYSLEEF